MLYVYCAPIGDVTVIDPAVGSAQVGSVVVTVGTTWSLIVMVVLHVAILLQASVTVHVIVEVPILKEPLASAPVPLLVVAPVIV